MNEFGQKGKVPLSERLSVSPEEASALTGIGLTSIREAISSGDLKAKKHGRRTIILPDDLRVRHPRACKCDQSGGDQELLFHAAYSLQMTMGNDNISAGLRHRS